jgi:DNA-binding MarR family transcriptional regulator
VTPLPEDRLDHILAQWRRERPELDVAPMGVLGRLLRAARLADSELATGLAPHDLLPGWFDLLAALRRAGTPYELTPTQLMDATMLSSGGITKRLDRLVEAGLVERRPDPEDRRSVIVGLTSAGKETIDRAVETHLANEERLLAALTPAETRALDDLLRKLLAELDRRP